MREIVRISIDDITPSPDAILKAQSVPERARNNIRTVQLTQESLQTYIELCNPVAVLMETSKTEFTDIYIGEGQNESETPLEDIYRESENLALFVVTVGEGVCREISRLFDVTDFA
ncbi:MAG: hypothetical protein U9R56_05675, partial [candidate division Zixibacteria bacterium]|nr:hypothetical protein [candidate division Zixibacteria bacterium]